MDSGMQPMTGHNNPNNPARRAVEATIGARTDQGFKARCSVVVVHSTRATRASTTGLVK